MKTLGASVTAGTNSLRFDGAGNAVINSEGFTSGIVSENKMKKFTM